MSQNTRHKSIKITSGSPDVDVARSVEILRKLDDGQDHVVIFADAEGRPEIRQWADARDVARGCLRVLEVPTAIGQAFNLGGAAPFAADELGLHLAERLGMTRVTAPLPISRAPWYISSAKARGILGYAPRHTVCSMVDEATVH